MREERREIRAAAKEERFDKYDRASGAMDESHAAACSVDGVDVDNCRMATGGGAKTTVGPSVMGPAGHHDGSLPGDTFRGACVEKDFHRVTIS